MLLSDNILYGFFFQNLLRVAWSPDGSKIAAGSGDRFVYVWDTTTRRIVYKLPGHAGSVNEVDFHPTESISKFSYTFKDLDTFRIVDLTSLKRSMIWTCI